MKELPHLDTLHSNIVAFAGAVIESDRPTLPDGTSGHNLHPYYISRRRITHSTDDSLLGILS